MIKTLEKYLENGLVMKNNHPTKDLIIWNYTKKTEYGKKWDDITLMCRSLVTDGDGNIISRSFPKFFNWFEMDTIPNEPFDVTVKMDGHLGNLFFYGGEWIFTSRGSFVSKHAIRGFELLQKYKYQKLDIDYTYIFEIIYDEGQVVVKYDFEDVILIGCVNNKTGIERLIHNCDFDRMGFHIVKKMVGIDDFNTLKTTIDDNMEGYVVRFVSGLRMKIKGDGYFQKQTEIIRMTNQTIWRDMKEGLTLLEILENVPDEYYPWVEQQYELLMDMFLITEVELHRIYLRELSELEDKKRKDVSKKIQSMNDELQPIMFLIYDRKPYSHLVWDRVKPKRIITPSIIKQK